MRKPIFHVDFDVISEEISCLKDADRDLHDELTQIVATIRGIEAKLDLKFDLEPLEVDERELWRSYQALQDERLTLMDVSHEWRALRPSLDEEYSGLAALIDNAVSESSEHMVIKVETMREHIDILAIENSRRLDFAVLVTTIIISYLAFWEVFVREFLLGFDFSGGLSPTLNYVLVVLSLSPMLVALYVSWSQHRVGRVDRRKEAK